MSIAKYIINIFINGSILFAMWLGIEYSFFRVAPITLWVEYENIRPAKLEFEIGEEMRFISNVKIRFSPHIHWNDVLMCEDPKTQIFVRIDEFESSSIKAENRLPETDVYWQWNGKLPKSPTTCYLNSQIQLHLPFGITKDDAFNGSVFTIK